MIIAEGDGQTWEFFWSDLAESIATARPRM